MSPVLHSQDAAILFFSRQMTTVNDTVKEHSKILDAKEFILKYRDYDKFSELCRKCPLYNKSWACPPFAHDIDGELAQFDKVLVHISQVFPAAADLPLSRSRELLRPQRIRLEKKFAEMERASGGLFLGFAGSCPCCPAGSCTRADGKACRFPLLCHPSLESYGFDLCKAASEIFGIEILWSSNGRVPAYLTLICGLFYKNPDNAG